MTAIALLIGACAVAEITEASRARRLASLQALIGLVIFVAHFAELRPWQDASPMTWSSRVTGLGLILSGVATLLLSLGRIRRGQSLAFATLLLTALIGMAHLVPHADLYKYLPGTGVSIPTILALLMLCMGQLFCFPRSGLIAALAPSKMIGGTGLRLMLGGFVMPLVLCGVVVAGYRRQMFDGETAVILISWGAMALLIAALWRLAVAVDDAERARIQLEKQRRSVQTTVMAALTHDARSPLQEATIYVAKLLKAKLPPAAEETVVRLQQSHGRIDRLLRSLLDSVWIDSGFDLIVNAVPCELQALVAQVVDDNEARLRGRVRIEGSPVEGRWDEDGLYRVVENLLLNAVKYGATGAEIVCCTESRGDARGILTVKNQGPAIPRERWEDVFQLFSRGTESFASTHVGWGVGLAYARAMVTRHGGSIEIHRSDQSGTVFMINLPLDGASS